MFDQSDKGIKEAANKQMDRRIKRTQQSLARALIALTLAKNYEDVTIRDITQSADVGYATFFRHYRDKDALLESVLDVVLDELMQMFSTPAVSDDDEVQNGVRLFQYVQQHSEMISVLLRSGAASSLVKRIIETHTPDEHEPSGNAIVPGDIAANHLITASIALIQWWLEQGMPYPPAQMGTIYYELVIRPTR
jgi:AcrR family transcriptional regulator